MWQIYWLFLCPVYFPNFIPVMNQRKNLSEKIGIYLWRFESLYQFIISPQFIALPHQSEFSILQKSTLEIMNILAIRSEWWLGQLLPMTNRKDILPSFSSSQPFGDFSGLKFLSHSLSEKWQYQFLTHQIFKILKIILDLTISKKKMGKSLTIWSWIGVS